MLNAYRAVTNRLMTPNPVAKSKDCGLQRQRDDEPEDICTTFLLTISNRQISSFLANVYFDTSKLSYLSTDTADTRIPNYRKDQSEKSFQLSYGAFHLLLNI